MTSQDDFDYLQRTAEIGLALNLSHFIHLAHPVGLWNYIRIANDIAARCPPGAALDWGCGFGQMTYLLRRRGFQVTPFDIGADDTLLPAVPLSEELRDIVRSTHPTRLPFPDAAFNMVLSCGVLEHVDEYSQPGNEAKSLAEIARILKPQGQFLIYQLPQRYAWQEAVLRRLKLGYSHPRRYTEAEIRGMLARAGYRVERVRRANFIPKNLTGMPNALRRVYSRFSQALIRLDGVLAQLPGLKHLAGVLEIHARKA